MNRPRVLIVDDSAFMRHAIRKILEADGGLEIVGDAPNGAEGLRLAESLQPDVITLDVEMPVMNGLAMLRELMERQPTPVVMLSSLVEEGATATLEALEMGAVDFVQKPGSGRASEVQAVADAIVRAVHGAATARVRAGRTPPAAPRARRTATPPTGGPPSGERAQLMVLGASTGGPPALGAVVGGLPADLPVPIVIVQHMPAGFTASFAERLNTLAAFPVQEASHGQVLQPGQAYVAPGGHHLVLGRHRTVEIMDGPPMHGVRPAIDVTLNSIPVEQTGRTVLAILTGMGRDGAEGAFRIKRAGGVVVAQDEATSVVYGMPRAVAELQAASRVAPLPAIAEALVGALDALRPPTRRSA